VCRRADGLLRVPVITATALTMHIGGHIAHHGNPVREPMPEGKSKLAVNT
jgi:hypothetical protein